MTDMDLLHIIPARDWEATPSSVRTLLLALLPLAGEVSELRAWVNEQEPRMDNAGVMEISDQRTRVERYQSLVDRLFLNGLTQEDQREMDRLGAEIDAGNASFFRLPSNIWRLLNNDHLVTLQAFALRYGFRLDSPPDQPNL